MKLSSLSLQVAGLLLIAALPARAELTNLLTNGDFATGQIAPWVVVQGTATPAAGYCALAGSIEQTIRIEEGGDFYLSLDTGLVGQSSNGIVPLILTILRNGETIAQIVHEELPGRLSALHYALNFTVAEAGPITVRIASLSTAVADIRLLRLPPSPRAGSYRGTAKIITSGSATAESEPVRLTENLKAVARIEQNGRFVIVLGTEVSHGILLEDDSFDLRLRGVRFTGTARAQGRRLAFAMPYPISDSPTRIVEDEGLQGGTQNHQVEISLTRGGG